MSICDRERDDLGTGDPGRPARLPAGRHEIINTQVHCRGEGIEVGVHEASLVDVAFAAPYFGALLVSSRARLPAGNVKSLI